MIGQSIPRIESDDKVRGSLEYLGDFSLPGMLHGKILRSPLPHANIATIDATKAEKIPGVVAILTRDDVIRNPRYGSHYGPVLKDQTVVALDKVRYMGDPVAAVAATTPGVAEEALESIEVDYQELPAVLDPEEALQEGAPLLHGKIELPSQGFEDMKDVGPKEGTNICNHFHLEKGDIEKGFQESDHIFEDVFTSPATQHAALEPFVAIANFDDRGKLTIWSTIQNPFVIRDQMAELWRLPLSKVRVISLYLGGGYGSKLYPKLEPLVAALAYKAGQPVGISLTREEVFQTITKHASKIYLKTGVKKDGTVVARSCRYYLNTGAYAEIGPRVSKKAGYTATGPYQTPHIKIDTYLTYTNCVPAGAFRGFGVSQSAWSHESQMAMIARALKMDPLELQRKNLLDHGGEFATGETVKNVAIEECLQKAADALSWGEKPSNPGPGKARGKGLACLIKATITPSVSGATVRLNEDGSLHIYVGTVEIGQGSDTLLAQIASQELAIPVEEISVVHSDTDSVPYDLTTSSSRSTFHMGRAVQLAAQDVRGQLAEVASKHYQVSPADLTFEQQTVRPEEDQNSALSYRELLTQHFGIKGINLVGSGTMKGEATDEEGRSQTSAFWFAGAGAAEVEVDTETGNVRIVEYATAVDVGRAINPKACEQQLRGAAIMGIGQTLLEELVYQEGLLINPNFLDYNLPRFLDMPEKIIPILVECPHPSGPYGAKGIGENGLIPVAPAVANAIEDAIGVRIKDLPITSEKVLRALKEKAEREMSEKADPLTADR